ncbi:MAG: sugar phosphate isomerase/epimerase [Ruminococcaceae bacterium]|nr:sugar phosphate isomerase/epimerase [Oscillospiraceae bacterium]
MKIGITESSYHLYPKENRYHHIKSDGYDYVDFSMSNTEQEPYTLEGDAFEAFFAQERAMADEAGVTIWQVHGPWRWPPQDGTEEDRAERMEKMKTSIRGTALLGCKNWIVHPIMPFGINELGTEDAQKTWDLNVVFMRELLAYAKEYDIIICFENMPMPNFSLGSVEAIMRFVREMDDDHFRVCLDTGHVNVFPEQSLYDAVLMIGDKLQTLHVHDNSGRSDEHKLPWFGTADWGGFGRALCEIGFSGVFSYETGPSRSLPLDLYGDMLRFMVKSVQYILDETEASS